MPGWQTLHQRTIDRRTLDLPFLTAQFMQTRIERRIRAPRRIKRQATRDKGRMKQPLGIKKRRNRQRRRGLRAVQKGQTLLGPQNQRLKPGRLQGLVAFEALT